MNAARITIFPRFPMWNSDVERDQAFKILIPLGMDISRLYEPTGPQDSRFIHNLQRTRCISQGIEKPFVVLTDTFPLPSCILDVRKQFAQDIPALEQALWVIWYDARKDVGFRAAAEKIGSFDRTDLDAFPIWTTKLGAHYLIVTPMSVDRKAAHEQLVRLLSLLRKPSGTFQAPR